MIFRIKDGYNSSANYQCCIYIFNKLIVVIGFELKLIMIGNAGEIMKISAE